jgi:hypothetical protein
MVGGWNNPSMYIHHPTMLKQLKVIELLGTAEKA